MPIVTLSNMSDLTRRASRSQNTNGGDNAYSPPLGFEHDGTYNLPLFQYCAIPKQTAIASYTTFTLTVPRGRLDRIWLEFPRGCSGLVGLQVYRGVYQLFPLPSGVWFISDNSYMSFRMSVMFMTVPFEITIRGYNLDDVYAHTPWIGLEFSNPDRPLSDNALKFLKEL